MLQRKGHLNLILLIILSSLVFGLIPYFSLFADEHQNSDSHNPFYQIYSDEKGGIRISFNIAPSESYYKKRHLKSQRDGDRENQKRKEGSKILISKVYNRTNGSEIFSELILALENNPMDIFERYDYWIERTLSNDFGHFIEESRYNQIFELIQKNLAIDREKQFTFFRHIASIYYTFYGHRAYPLNFPTAKECQKSLKSKKRSKKGMRLKFSQDQNSEPAPLISTDFILSRIFYNTREITEDNFEIKRMGHVFIHSLAFDYYMRNQSYFIQMPKSLKKFLAMFESMTMGGTYNTEFNAINAMKYNYIESIYRPIYIQKLEKTQSFYRKLSESLEGSENLPLSQNYKEIRKAQIHKKHQAIKEFMENNSNFIQENKLRDDDEISLFLLVFLEKLQDYGPDYHWRDVLLDLMPLIFHKDFDFFKDFIARTYFHYIVSGNASSSYVRPFNPNDPIDLQNLYSLLHHDNFTNMGAINEIIITFMKIHGRKLEKKNKDVPERLVNLAYQGNEPIPQYDWEVVIDTIHEVTSVLPYIQ